MSRTFKVTESEFKLLPVDTLFKARLDGIEIKTVTPKDASKDPFDKLKWCFKIMDGDFADQKVWGETSDTISPSPNNKFYAWACALLGREAIDLGIDLDVDDLVGLRCELSVEHEPGWKDPSQVYAKVDSVFPMLGGFGSSQEEPPF